MNKPVRRGKGVIIGKDVWFGEEVRVWNFVVIGDGSKIGAGTVIGSFCDIGKNVRIGAKCCLQAHVTISNESVLEDGVFIAPNSSLLNDKYPVSGHLSAPKIKRGAVRGGGVTILPHLTVGEEAVVGGGCLVTGDVPGRTVHVGLPNRETMILKEYKAKRERLPLVSASPLGANDSGVDKTSRNVMSSLLGSVKEPCAVLWSCGWGFCHTYGEGVRAQVRVAG